jgi:O-antigen ligase
VVREPPPAALVTADTDRAALRFGLFALLMLAPLPFGSVQPLAVLILELTAAALCGVASWGVVERPGLLTPPARRMLWPCLGLLAVGLLQLVPLPAAWIAWLAPATATAREATGALLAAKAAAARATLSAPDTLDALLRLASYVGIGLASAVALRVPRLRQHAVLLIVGCAVFQAVYGSAEYVSGHQHIFGYVKKYYTDSATGTFINRNHFAAYLALCLPFALELLVQPGSKAAQRGVSGWRSLLLRLHEPAGALRVFGGLAAASIWAGVFFSYSRGGLAASLVGAAMLPVFLSRGIRVKVLVAILIAPLALLVLWQDVRAPGERFLGDPEEIETLNSRLPVWQASLGLVRDYPLLGSGYGTFDAVFPNRQPAGVSNRWDHAHNDWLEAQVEGGLAASVCLLWLAWLCFAPGARPAHTEGPRYVVGLAAARAGLCAIAVHCLVDFPVRIPAIAVTVAVVMGLVASGKSTR